MLQVYLHEQQIMAFDKTVWFGRKEHKYFYVFTCKLYALLSILSMVVNRRHGLEFKYLLHEIIKQ